MGPEVGALLRLAEDRAEALAGLARLAVAAILLAVVLVATRDMPVATVPMLQRQIAVALVVVAAFAAHGLVTVVLARRGRIGRRGRFAVAGIDVLLVMANLGLNLANMDLAGNWLVSLPAAWLLPLLFAYAALRLDPLLAAWSVGLTLTALVAVAAWAGWDTSPLPVAPASLAPFYSLPPLAVRAVMLLLAGAVVVVAVARGRDLLLRGIDAERRRLNLTRYLPPQLAETLAGGDLEALRRGRRQRAALLFVDVRGFTARAETMPPEALGRFVDGFRAAVTAAADRHGGVIDKFIGDGALIVFGVPQAAADDAARALACGDALIAAASTWSAQLAARGEAAVTLAVGLHVGEVFVGVLGGDGRLEHTVLGDTVNTAQRLQGLSREVGLALLASADLLAAAGTAADRGDWQHLPERRLRGRRQPLAILGRYPIPASGFAAGSGVA